MIGNLRIVGERVKVDGQLKRYATEKIGKLDKYLPRRARRVVAGEVMLRHEKGRRTGDDIAEAILDVPDGRLTAKATGPSLYAAIDLVEEKLKQQLGKYKGEHSPRFYQHLMRRLRRR